MMIEIEGREIDISSADRVVFPEVGVTKGDVAQYYADVGPAMVRHLVGRPLSLVRHPKGTVEKGFFQKNTPDFYPDWIPRIRLPKKGGHVDHAGADDAAAMVYFAQQGMITPHIGLARAADLDRPDRFVVDLDPSTDDFHQVRRVAIAVGDALRSAGLVPFAQVTGSKGIHVVAPLRPASTFGEVHRFAAALATLLHERLPDDLTQEFHKAERGDRIYLDLGRNGFSATMVAPYAIRPRPTAPVATPVTWDEVADPDLRPDRWTVASVRERLAEVGDPWAHIDHSARPLPGA